MTTEQTFNPTENYPGTGLQLLRDFTDFRTKKHEKAIIAEDKHIPLSTGTGESPVMRVVGILQEAEIVNENFRVYPRSILQEAVNDIQEDIKARGLYGEYGHPDNAKINMDRISHINTKARMNGNEVLGEIEILDNQIYGRSLRGLFESRCRVCTSSRGLGEVKELLEHSGHNQYVVQDGYRIICWDMVADPSVRRAVLRPLNESRNRIIKAAQEEERRTGKLVTEETRVNMMLDAINKYFGIKDIGPRPKVRR